MSDFFFLFYKRCCTFGASLINIGFI